MPLESLVKNLTAAFAEYDAAIAKAYTCTCDWSTYDDHHADRCPRELRLQDVEASRI
jgi:hypothetical protein